MCYSHCRYQNHWGECVFNGKELPPDADCRSEEMHDEFAEKFEHEPSESELDDYISQEMSEYE